MSSQPTQPKSEATLLEKLAFTIQVVYMLRVPMLLGAAVFLFPLIAHFLAPTLLSGLYDFSDGPFLGAFWYALFVFLFAWVVMISGKLCLHGGPQRMAMADNAARSWFRVFRTKAEKKGWLFIVVLIFSVVAISGVFWVRGGELASGHRLLLTGGSVAGFVLSIILLYFADILHSSLYKPPGVAFTTLHIFPVETKRLKRLRARPNFALVDRLFGWLKRPIDWFRQKEVLSRGYFAVSKDPKRSLPPISGHVTALVLMLVFLIVYIVFGFGDRFTPLGSLTQGISYQQFLYVPAIVYIPILCTMLCWVLSAASFFLDGYRIPLILPVAVWVFIGSFWQESYYTVVGPPEKTATAPVRAENKDDYMILVSADGGGIQAAAWTARVLTGIVERCPGCAGKIRMISGVSGGSVGTMYYVDALNDQNRGLPSSLELRDVRTRAASSSLRSVAWGLAYPDLLNAFAPFFNSGRGNELERDWGRNLRVEGGVTIPDTHRLEQPLSSWKPGVIEGWRPDVIFNTTMVESGGRVLMTTSDILNKAAYDRFDKRFTFQDLYPGNDVPVASAVRMSASFPYVTPVACALFEGGSPKGVPLDRLKRYEGAHLADGGYFDNYGTVSLLEWLDMRLRQGDGPKKVIIIQIRCGDVTSVELDKDKALSRVYQLSAPLTTLYNVRTAGQRERSDKEIEMTQNLRDGHYKDVDVRSVIFNFEGIDNPAGPPLSWHLAPIEKQQICLSWSAVITRQKKFEEINEILAAFGAADRIKDDKTAAGNCEDPNEIKSLGL